MSAELPPKKDVARGLLLRGSVFVHLDPRVEGTAVPKWLAVEPQLVLQIGLDLPIPIPDLRVDDAGIFGTLSFQRSPFPCTVPWEAVFALVGEDGRGVVWREALPEEIAAEVDREAGRKKPPELSLVPEPEVEAQLLSFDREVRPERAKPAPRKEPRSEPRRIPPYLRVVK